MCRVCDFEHITLFTKLGIRLFSTVDFLLLFMGKIGIFEILLFLLTILLFVSQQIHLQNYLVFTSICDRVKNRGVISGINSYSISFYNIKIERLEVISEYVCLDKCDVEELVIIPESIGQLSLYWSNVKKIVNLDGVHELRLIASNQTEIESENLLYLSASKCPDLQLLKTPNLTELELIDTGIEHIYNLPRLVSLVCRECYRLAAITWCPNLVYSNVVKSNLFYFDPRSDFLVESYIDSRYLIYRGDQKRAFPERENKLLKIVSWMKRMYTLKKIKAILTPDFIFEYYKNYCSPDSKLGRRNFEKWRNRAEKSFEESKTFPVVLQEESIAKTTNV